MRNFSGTAVAAAPCYGCLKYGCLKIKNLIQIIVLIAIGVALPLNASAKIDPVILEKQRAENKARLEKNEELRTGKPKKKFLDKKEEEAYKARTLKLDAIQSSPRRHAK